MVTEVEWKASSIMIDEEVVIPHGDSFSEDDEEESDAVPIIPEEEDDNDTFNLTILEQMSESQRTRTHDTHKHLLELVKQTVATEEDTGRNHGGLRVCEGQKGSQCIHCNNKFFIQEMLQ